MRRSRLLSRSLAVLGPAVLVLGLAGCGDDDTEVGGAPAAGDGSPEAAVAVYRDFARAVAEDDPALFETAAHPSYGTDLLRAEPTLAGYLDDLTLGAERDMLVLPDDPEVLDVEDVLGPDLDDYVTMFSEQFGIDGLTADDIAFLVLPSAYDRGLDARSTEECSDGEVPIEDCIHEATGELDDVNLVMVRDDGRWYVAFTEPA